MSRTRRFFRRLTRDHLTKVALVVMVFYAVAGISVRFGILGWMGGDPDAVLVTEQQDFAFRTEPDGESWTRWLGTDRQGRSILVRALHGIDIAWSVGLVTGLLAVVVG
ncbi:MAG: hypothetical protein AAF533_07260, partial [Acidobacteriota bacterium]